MRIPLIFLGLCLTALSLNGQDCERPGSSSKEILARRKALLNLMDSSSALVIKAADADWDVGIDPYRQSPDFMYISGIDESGYKIIFSPKGYAFGSRLKHVMIFTYSDPSGAPLATTSSDTVLMDKLFKPILDSIVRGVKTLYYSPVPGLSVDWVNNKVVIAERETKKTFEAAHLGLKLKPAAKLFSALRQIKTDEETGFMRQAIGMTGSGIVSVMKQCKPGIYEYEAQAIIEYEAKRRGAECMAFASIIGSGKNSLSPHYDKNTCKMKRGDVVVIDVGARYGDYCADITRTIPVSGKFSQGQKTIYQAVLDIQKGVIAIVRPGITMGDLDKKTAELTRQTGFGKYIIHGVTHPLGLLVHDVSSGDTLRPGMIITVEPGIYIPVNDSLQPAERRGFGIRIEDDVLVTADGYDLLSKDIPKEIADIEKLMKSRKQ